MVNKRSQNRKVQFSWIINKLNNNIFSAAIALVVVGAVLMIIAFVLIGLLISKQEWVWLPKSFI